MLGKSSSQSPQPGCRYIRKKVMVPIEGTEARYKPYQYDLLSLEMVLLSTANTGG